MALNAFGSVPRRALLVRFELEFYGARYWTQHQTDVLGHPPIAERARTDLAEHVYLFSKQAASRSRCWASSSAASTSEASPQRVSIIEGLGAACDERLPVIERFDRELRQRA